MNISTEFHRDTAVLALDGRLDGYTARELDAALSQLLEEEDPRNLVLDLSRLSYLSSAGIRSIIATLKTLRRGGGELAFAGLHGYCEQVLNMAGFAGQIQNYPNPVRALEALGHSVQAPRWNPPRTGPVSGGSFRACAGASTPARMRVLGHIEDVLWSQVTAEKIRSKRFSQTEYSIGLGALGDRLEDYIGLMGEMITIGGTMVWLPTDGNDTPDYLIPRTDTGEVTIRTGFNVSLEGDFHSYYDFTSADPVGATISEIYGDLFALERAAHPNFRGALATAMRADMATVHGSGVRFSPILAHQPENGKMIIDPANFAAWFEVDETPRWENVTGLLTGIGIDLTAPLDAYDKDLLGACFYLNPANPSASERMLHNHGVFFNPLPFPPGTESLVQEIDEVVDRGTFVDMRHLLDGSRIRRALIGVARIEDFIADPEGKPL